MIEPPSTWELGVWKFLHTPSEGAIICSGCEHSWPCPTRRLIDAYEAQETRLIVLSYATWSEECYAASWYTHSPETVKAAREWWAHEQQRPLTEYEQAVVNEWRSQEAHHD